MLRPLESAALLLALALPAFAGDAGSLARYLPPETPFYMAQTVPHRDEMRRLAIYRALEDPALKALLERVLGDDSSITTMTVPVGPAALRVNVDLSSPEFTVNVEYVDGQQARSFRFRNSFALAWIGLAPGPFPVDAAAALQVEGDAREAVEILRRLLGAASLALRGDAEGDVDAELDRVSHWTAHREVSYLAARLGPVGLFLIPLDGLVIVATTEERARDLIGRRLDGTAASLATEERFTKALSAAGGTGSVTSVLALQVDRGLDAIQARFPRHSATARAALRVVGLNGLRGLTSISRVDGSGFHATTSVHLVGPRRGLARLFEGGKPAQLRCLEFAPRDTLYVVTGRFSPGRLYDMALEVGGYGVAMAAGDFQQRFGLRLKEDLLDLVGPEAALIVAPNRGLIPDVALVLESPDAARLERGLLKLLEKPRWPAGTGVRSFRVAGGLVHTVPLGHRKLADFPICPAFGVVDGRLLVTLYPMSFQRIAAVKRGQKPGLDENRDFAGLFERVPEDALSISYMDMRRLVEILYETAVPLLQSLPQPLNTSPFYEMPDVEVFSRHVYGRIAWRTAGEGGMQWHAHGAIDTGGFALMMFGAGVASFMALGLRAEDTPETMPVGAKTRPLAEPRRNLEGRMCRDRMRLIRARIHLYQREHDGKLPGSLDELRARHVRPESFLVPGCGKPYVYLGPEGRGEVLAHGYPNGADKKICVLTTALVVKRLTEAELSELLGSAPARSGR